MTSRMSDEHSTARSAHSSTGRQATCPTRLGNRGRDANRPLSGFKDVRRPRNAARARARARHRRRSLALLAVLIATAAIL